MEFFNFESVTSGTVGGVVSAIIVGIGVLLRNRFKQWSKNRRLKLNMRVALRECRAKTIKFMAYADDDLAKHFEDVRLDDNPFYGWLRSDEDGFDRRRLSAVGQKYFALVKHAKNIGYVRATDGTPDGIRAYADDIVAKVDVLLMLLLDPSENFSGHQ